MSRRYLSIPPVNWDKTVGRMKPGEIVEAIRYLEGMAMKCATFAAYLDERHGGGCGDQGHKKAVRNSNRVGRLLWRRGFGYNAFRGISF